MGPPLSGDRPGTCADAGGTIVRDPFGSVRRPRGCHAAQQLGSQICSRSKRTTRSIWNASETATCLRTSLRVQCDLESIVSFRPATTFQRSTDQPTIWPRGGHRALRERPDAVSTLRRERGAISQSDDSWKKRSLVAPNACEALHAEREDRCGFTTFDDATPLSIVTLLTIAK